MTEKVVLTKEQADALDFALKESSLYKRHPDKLLSVHAAEGEFKKNLRPLNDLRVCDLAKALYVGYEIEPEFEKQGRRFWAKISRDLQMAKPGDVVVLEDNSFFRETLEDHLKKTDCTMNDVDGWIAHGVIKGIYPIESFVKFGDQQQ